VKIKQKIFYVALLGDRVKRCGCTPSDRLSVRPVHPIPIILKIIRRATEAYNLVET